MNFPLFQIDLANPWVGMCQRLEPLLGDVRGALGQAWHQKAEAIFTQADFVVAQAVLQDPTLPDWHLIRYAPAGRRLDENEDIVACAPSWTDAVASLLGACEDNRLMPSSLAYDEAQHILELRVGEELLATVERFRSKPVRPELRQRALNTVSGLRRRHSDAVAELLKRVRKWPGLDRVDERRRWEAHEMQQFRDAMAHQPIPREWLLSALNLCIICGKEKPSMAEMQSIAATALGAQSWNHLSGPLGDLSARLLQPWCIWRDDEVYAFHADAADAVASLLWDAQGAGIADWNGVALDTLHSFTALDYIPTYALVEETAGQQPALGGARRIAACPVSRVGVPGDDLVQRVHCLAARRTDEIAGLFGVGLTGDAKARMLDERSLETLVVQEGRWRFTRTGDPHTTTALLWVHCVDNRGNSLWSAAAPVYKGLLQTHRETGLYVLCADYDGAHPVAVIDGLSPLAAARVRASFPDTRDDRLVFRESARRPTDLDAFQRLLQQALTRRLPV